jgi:DNA-binding CsgD family transcriptional regulator
LALARKLGNKPMTGWALFRLASITLFKLGEPDGAQSLFEEAKDLFQEIGYRNMVTAVLNSLGEVARARGDLDRSVQYIEESLVKSINLGMKPAMRAKNLGETLLEMGNEARAMALFGQSLDYALYLGSPYWIAQSLLAVAHFTARQGHPATAISLLGTCQAVFSTIGYAYDELERTLFDEAIALTRSSLDETSFDAHWAEGHSMLLDEAVTLAQEALERIKAEVPPRPLQAANSKLSDPLTDRELDVLRLLIEGRRNREIAEVLTVTINTVKTHLKHIYQKLDVNNRVQAVTRAKKLDLH